MQHCIAEVLDGAGLFGTLTVMENGWMGWHLRCLGICLWMLWTEADVWKFDVFGLRCCKGCFLEKVWKEVVVLKDTIYRL